MVVFASVMARLDECEEEGGGNALGGEGLEDGVGIKVGRHERHVRRSRHPSERSPPREIRRDFDRSSASETKRGRGERARSR